MALVCLAGTVPAQARRKLPNMPPGWVWPPSRAMQEEGRACLRRLAELGMKWERAGATRMVVTPVVVPDMSFGGLRLLPRGQGPQVLDCQLAEALAVHAAPVLRGLGVVALRVGSLHRFKRVAGTRILSRHATGLALDVMAVVDAHGVEHVVTRYFRDPLLRRVAARLRTCRAFRRPLTPGNDRKDHSDHFHLEARTALERSLLARPSS